METFINYSFHFLCVELPIITFTSMHYNAFWIQNLAPTAARATQDNNTRAHVSVFFAFVH